MPTKKGKPQPAGVGMTPSKTELGSFIRARRLELNLLQVELAKKVGFAQTFLSGIEVGRFNYLNDRQLDGLAKAFKCDAAELRKRMPVKHVAQPTTELGKLIRSRREARGLSIEALAKKLKITAQRARRLELRRSPSIAYSLVRPLATALDIAPAVLGKFAGTTQKETASALGQLIRSRRKELGMSITKLAEKLKVSRQLVNQIEFGQCPLSKNDDMITQLAQVLEIDVSKLETLRPERRRKKVKPTNPLGGFLAAKRLELNLTQREVSERADTQAAVVSAVETGRVHPSSNLLKKLATALNCQIPPELIPPPRERKKSHCSALLLSERATPLGQLITTRRIELGMGQRKLAEQVGVSTTMISLIERGAHGINGQLAESLSKALDCEIPMDLIPEPKARGRPRGPRTDQEGISPLVQVHLSEQNLTDLERIKELSDIRSNLEVVRKALKVLRLLLEKQKDEYALYLRKDKEIVELEFLF